MTNFSPLPHQSAVLDSSDMVVLMETGMGGGKTETLIHWLAPQDLIQDPRFRSLAVVPCEQARVYFLERALTSYLARGAELYTRLGEIAFPSGARVAVAPIDRLHEYSVYSFHRVGVDNAHQIDKEAIRSSILLARAGIHPQVLITSNLVH